MHHYRQVLMRMRQGDSDRDIARSRLMGRRSAAAFRALAMERGWLADQGPLPDDEAIAGALAGPNRASTTVSSLAPLRDQIAAWFDQGVSGVVIHTALKREHGYTGLYLGDQPLAVIDSPQGRALVREESGLGQIMNDLGQALASWTNDPGLVWLHTDHLGAPVAASNGQGRVVWRANYSPLGQAVVANAEGFNLNLNLRLPGQYRDEETGLYYNRARYYDPELGRYLTPDPLGTPDGPNPYAYAAYNPLRYIDPDGLVLFAFDGTGNDESDPDTISNVVKFRDMYNSDEKKNFYITGPGTHDPRSGIKNPKSKGGKLADEASSLTGKERITYLIGDLQRYSNTAEDDKAVDIDIVGFSRGAAQARDFANQIVSATTNGWYKYESEEDGKTVTRCQKVNFRFMGLFDTVLSVHTGSYALGIPDEFAYVSQAVALNEYRGGAISFPVESIMQGPYSTVPVEGRTRVERGFLGAHSDIGGGFEQGDLSKIALNWMVGQATKAGVSMDESELDRTIIANPVIHDKSSNLLSGAPDGGPAAFNEDRKVRYRDGSSSKQRSAVVDGMSYTDTVKYITYKSNPNSFDYISGTVDAQGYLDWLNEHGYELDMTVN